MICLMLVIGWDWLRWLALHHLCRRGGHRLVRRLPRPHDEPVVGSRQNARPDRRQAARGRAAGDVCVDARFLGLELIPAIAILIREIFVSGLREYLGGKDVSVPVTFLAKWKTTRYGSSRCSLSSSMDCCRALR